MWRNYLIAALRNLARNKLYAAINILGLVVGFTAALLIALFVRDELSYDRWLPSHENIYRVGAGNPGLPAWGVAPADLGQWLRLEFPQMQAVTRVFGDGGSMRRGEVESLMSIAWVDANFFEVFQLQTIAGELKGALDRPDSLVITRKVARMFFGRDDPVGETVELYRQIPMRIAAVIEDLPSNTHLQLLVLAPAHAPFSKAAEQDRVPIRHFGKKLWNTATYFVLKPGASLESVERALPGMLDRRTPSQGPRKTSDIYLLTVEPVAAIHLGTSAAFGSRGGGSLQLLYALGAVGLLIVFVASINFINLMTARATRRAVDVGVRKTSGARRRDLIAQFIGESMLHVTIAMMLAIMLVELLLPSFNALIYRQIVFDYWQDARFAGAIAGFTLLVGFLAGLYPALVLSSFRPATVLKGGKTSLGGAGLVRQVLVIAQFAVLIGLILISIVFHRQHAYALEKSMQLDSDPMMLMNASCRDALVQQIAALPGVRGVSCSWQAPHFGIGPSSGIQRRDGEHQGLRYTSVDIGFFELYGYRPVAGRFFSRGSDSASPTGETPVPEAIVINETAARKLGFASPAQAVGQILIWDHLARMPSIFTGPHDIEIIGVAPDFPIGSIRDEIPAAAFYVNPIQMQTLHARLDRTNVAQTLVAIEKIWKQFGDPRPFAPYFFDQAIRNLYANVSRQGRAASIFTGVALFIGCLGLLGLSVFTAQRRTKEIGIRKAMGARTGNVMALLLWEFTRPVLWATLIAFPLGYYLMHRWLESFAYHIDLQAWMFIAAAAAAVIIALITVISHSLMVARARPVEALRHE